MKNLSVFIALTLMTALALANIAKADDAGGGDSGGQVDWLVDNAGGGDSGGQVDWLVDNAGGGDSGGQVDWLV